MDNPPAIPADRVANILPWQNNCALSCTAIFLIDSLLRGKLTEQAATTLTTLINDYYNTSLTTEELKEFFTHSFTLPSDRQIMIGPVLRNFIYSKGVVAETDNMLSNEAFIPLAKAFECNVIFYTTQEHQIKESGIIPKIIIKPANQATLRPYFAGAHFDLIMEESSTAQEINNAAFQESPHNLHIEHGEEKALRLQIKQLILNHTLQLAEEQQTLQERHTLIEKQLEELEQTITILPATSSTKAELVQDASTLRNRCNTFFAKSAKAKGSSLANFKQESEKLVTTMQKKANFNNRIIQILKNILLCIATLVVGYAGLVIARKLKQDKFFFFTPENNTKPSITPTPFK